MSGGSGLIEPARGYDAAENYALRWLHDRAADLRAEADGLDFIAKYGMVELKGRNVEWSLNLRGKAT